MKCPICGDIETKVIDSRVVKDNEEIRRRRLCDNCAHRFTTYERAERAFPMVIKKDGRREQWDRTKIHRGLTKAFEKRPVSIEAIDSLIDEVERDIAVGGTEIASRAIGEHIMTLVRELDQVAYVRFASVYRSFRDIGEFVTEIEAMETGRNTPPPGGLK